MAECGRVEEKREARAKKRADGCWPALHGAGSSRLRPTGMKSCACVVHMNVELHATPKRPQPTGRAGSRRDISERIGGAQLAERTANAARVSSAQNQPAAAVEGHNQRRRGKKKLTVFL